MVMTGRPEAEVMATEGIFVGVILSGRIEYGACALIQIRCWLACSQISLEK